MSLTDQINQLPDRLRNYVHDLETRCDPAGDVRRAYVAEETVTYFQMKLYGVSERSPERVEFLKDIVIGAIEGGGCDYWSYNRDYDFRAGAVELLEDEHDPDAKDVLWYKIDIDVVERGLAKIKDPGFQINPEIRGRILVSDIENDAGDPFDAPCADAIVQAALFGELVYG